MRMHISNYQLFLRKIAAVVLLTLCLGPYSGRCFAQNSVGPIDIGFPPNAVFHGSDLDHVNLDNGNLHIEIPLWSTNGRGMPVGYRLIYDSKGFTSTDHCTRDGSCSSVIQAAPGNHLIMLLVGPFGYSMQRKGPLQRCGTQQTDPTVNVYTSTLFEPDGTSHLMVPSQYYTNTSVTCSLWPLNPTLYASDGTGWVSTPTGTIRRKDGTVVSGVITDTNGNQLNPGNPATDTLGRTIPSDGSYYDSTGTHQIVQITNTTVTLQTHLCQFAHYSPCQEYSTGNVVWTVPQKITLPNGQTFTITYVPNDYGEIASIALPTGGQISWGWGTLDSGGRWVASRTVSVGGNSYTWNYGTVSQGHSVTDPNGNTMTKICAVTSSNTYGSWCSTQQIQYYSGSATSGQLLKTFATDFSPHTCDSGNCGFLPIRETTTWNPTNQVAKNETDWYFYATPSTNEQISWGNPLETREFDYGTGTPGAQLRRTDFTYLHQSNSSYLNANVADRTTSKVVYPGTSTRPIAQTTFGYDGSTVTPTSGAPNHDYTNFSSTNNIRGNLTQTSRWVNTTNTWLNISNTYNDLGDLLSTTDALNNTTNFSYTDNFSDGVNRNALAFVTQITHPTTNGVAHVERKQYYWNTSLPATACGQNFPAGTTCTNTATIPQSDYTKFSYDSVNRPLNITRGDGGQTNYSYNDTVQPLNVSVTSSITSSSSLAKTAVFDGLGRVAQTQLTSDPDCSSGDKTDTTYDAFGRVHSVTSPYCATSDPTYGLTMYAYDALGRTTQITHPDNSTILTTYNGRGTQVQDEGNGTQRVTHVSQSDALGRLTSVCEVSSASLIGFGGTPIACGQDIAATGFLTTYQYDALDDLVQVNQSGIAPRTFTYDSLSRLLSASNPESGTVTYTYDALSNVHTKTDARNITTCLGDWAGTTCNGATGYDALNRVLKKTYSDGTPAATFSYDQTSALGVTLTNTIGRKSSESTAGSLPSGSVFSYDPMGRLVNNSQCTPQNCGTGVFAIQYPQHDFLGELVSGTNAAGVTLTYSYNSAARLTGISSNFVDASHPGTLLSQAAYNAPGFLKTVKLGNGLTETRNYNSRLWLTSLAAGSAYSLNMTSYAPNGDVLAANDSVNGNWTYAYDAFNRLLSANASGQSYTYDYDRFGNRWHQNGPRSSQLGFDANNRITGVAGVGYDSSGNLTSDGSGPGAHTYFFDAENRISQVDGTLGNCATATACYIYDAEGRRVRKATASSGTLDFLYDAEGHKVAEVDPTGTFLRGELFAAGRHFAVFAPEPGPTGATFFTHADWIGTERARTDMTGAVCESITSLAFGDGQTITGNCSNSSGDVSSLHFTGKERDAESGLDNFGARYNSSNFGRFMSPDLNNAGSTQDDPQSWNLYPYVKNNPLNAIDPNGKDVVVCIQNGTDSKGNAIYNCKTYSDEDYQKLLNEQQGQQGVVLPSDHFPSGFVTCGGQVCGFAAYYEPPLEDDTVNLFAVVGGIQGLARLSRFAYDAVASLFARESILTLGLEGAAEAANAAVRARQVIAQEAFKALSAEQKALLQEWLGPIKNTAQITPPPVGLTREAMEVYKDLAQAAKERSIFNQTTQVVQPARILAIDRALGNVN